MQQVRASSLVRNASEHTAITLFANDGEVEGVADTMEAGDGVADGEITARMGATHSRLVMSIAVDPGRITSCVQKSPL